LGWWSVPHQFVCFVLLLQTQIRVQTFLEVLFTCLPVVYNVNFENSLHQSGVDKMYFRFHLLKFLITFKFFL
jgi:hypothetical protein